MDNFSIPDNEFVERVARVQQLMAAEGIDTLIAYGTESEPAMTRYFSDFWPIMENAGVLIPGVGEPVLLIGMESENYARSRSRIKRVIRQAGFRSVMQPDFPGEAGTSWHEIFREFPTNRLGVAGWSMFPHPMYAHIREALGRKGEIVSANRLVWQLMMRKSEAELRCLREAARLATLGLQAILDQIEPGMTELQVTAIGVAAVMANGAEGTGYSVWCGSGPHSTEPISYSSHRKIQRNEIIQIQTGARVAGYSTSIGRPILIGSCSDEMRRFLEVGMTAADMTVDMMRAGTPAAEIAHRVHGWITEQGYGDTILYGPAHGCGLREGEQPTIETTSPVTLEENMAFQIDVFLARPNMGFRWEDCIVVRKDGAEQLTGLGREIIILP